MYKNHKDILSSPLLMQWQPAGNGKISNFATLNLGSFIRFVEYGYPKAQAVTVILLWANFLQNHG